MSEQARARRERWLRAARFERPDRVPIRCGISNAIWHHHPHDAIQALMASHLLLFPDYSPWEGQYEPKLAPWRRADSPHTDSWGCVWVTAEDGLTGAVSEHPLADWSAWDQFADPDPAHEMGWGPIDWEQVEAAMARTEAEGGLKQGSLRHGHTFLTLSYVRGYENLLFDMVDDDPHLGQLIERVEAFNLGLVERYVALGVEWMGYPEDLGMQVGPLLSPAQFCHHIKPSYQRLIAPAREAGCVIHMHSDGDLHQLADDLIEGGVDALNLQDMVNGVDWIAEHLKGRVCIDLDIDRQNVTRTGPVEAIDAHVRHIVEALGDRQGGLMLTYEFSPGTSVENAGAVMDAMERYAGMYSG